MTSITRQVIVDSQRIDVPARDPSIAASPRNFHTGNVPAITSASGTDATPVVTETYLAEIHVPDNVTLTGVAIFNGSVAAGNVTVGIYTPGGKIIAQSASTAISGTDAYQLVPLPLALVPGTYYIATQYDNTSARFNTHVVGAFGAGKVTGTVYGTFGNITAPTTFTTGLGPIASLY